MKREKLWGDNSRHGSLCLSMTALTPSCHGIKYNSGSPACKVIADDCKWRCMHYRVMMGYLILFSSVFLHSTFYWYTKMDIASGQ